jgi:hypothetical protein
VGGEERWEEGWEVHCRGKLGVLGFRLNEMRQCDALLGSSWEEAGWFHVGLCSSQNDSIKLSVIFIFIQSIVTANLTPVISSVWRSQKGRCWSFCQQLRHLGVQCCLPSSSGPLAALQSKIRWRCCTRPNCVDCLSGSLAYQSSKPLLPPANTCCLTQSSWTFPVQVR